jgi:hypothetical protein
VVIVEFVHAQSGEGASVVGDIITAPDGYAVMGSQTGAATVAGMATNCSTVSGERPNTV